MPAILIVAEVALTPAMATEQQRLALGQYAARIREARRANPAASEPGLAPQFGRLLEELLPLLPAAPALTVLHEYVNAGVGRPDIALARPGQPPRAFVELKATDKSTNGASWSANSHDGRQFRRFGELAHWGVCNFHDLRLYERDQAVGHAALLPSAALDPAQTDAAANRAVDGHDPDAALRLLERLAQTQPPTAADAPQLALLLAHAARLVRGIVRDRLAELTLAGGPEAPLQQVRREFRDVLYAHPEAGGYSGKDFDELFSGAFAQTLAFGLLLVREATQAPVDHRAHEHMPPEHPLMRTALQVLSLEPVAREIGAGFDVMLDTVNGFDPAILAVENGRDPILYFYEDFLRIFDERARDKHGVWYTPVPVVRFMVGALDRVLRERLGAAAGLGDEQVHILDPAVGTGTFLLAIADRLRRGVEESDGPGQVPVALNGLARRMYGFELLVGPYAVAHYRLHHALSRPPADGQPPIALPRLGVYLTDTLAEPGSAAPAGALGFVSAGISDERREADRVKTAQPILAIIGNPPYRRLERGENETLVGRWMDQLWDDLKAPVRDAGWGNQLNTFPELSVAFWRWSLWKLFEAENAPGRGVVVFISNRKFLTGKPYAGVRQRLRERFDRLEIIDLRGDSRVGERAGVHADQNVFDIQVGVAITIAIADGSRAAGEPATVTYSDAWAQDCFARERKFDWLLSGENTGTLADGLAVDRSWLDNLRLQSFEGTEALDVSACFGFRVGGFQTKRDDFAIAFSREALAKRVSEFIDATDEKAQARFHSTRDRSWADAKMVPYSAANLRDISYRPLDRRVLYNERQYGDFLRPELQAVWGAANNALYAMPFGTAGGPAVWCHGLLPDYHAFRGSYGGYAFPLYDHRAGHGPHNLSPDLLEALGAVYGEPVTPEATFDVILCLLSASTYTLRFAEDLEDAFPHVPFPRDREVFDRAAALGAEIRAVEIFARPPEERFMRGFARAVTAPAQALASEPTWDAGRLTLCADGSGVLENVPEAVWTFSVSGYRLLYRWLAARAGQPVTPALIPEVRDLVGRIAELLDRFAAADTLLEQTLADPVSRARLELRPEEPEPDADE